MLNFLQGLLPRLKQFSQSLDQTELFVDKPWVLIDEDGQQQTYIFRRSGELLMSLDGQVQMGTWDYIAAAQSLLIDRGVDKLLLNHFFFTDALLVLARDGRQENKFVLANRQLIPDLNVEKYLSALEARQVIQSRSPLKIGDAQQLHEGSVKTVDGLLLTFFSVKNNVVSVGDASYIDGKPTPNGRYVSEMDWGVIIKDGVIQSVFWPKNYSLKTGEQVTVDCQGKLIAPNCFDRIFWQSGLPIENGKHRIVGVGKVQIVKGCIESFSLF